MATLETKNGNQRFAEWEEEQIEDAGPHLERLVRTRLELPFRELAG